MWVLMQLPNQAPELLMLLSVLARKAALPSIWLALITSAMGQKQPSANVRFAPKAVIQLRMPKRCFSAPAAFNTFS